MSYQITKNDFMAQGGDGYPVVYGRSTIQGRIFCTTSDATACPVV